MEIWNDCWAIVTLITAAVCSWSFISIMSIDSLDVEKYNQYIGQTLSGFALLFMITMFFGLANYVGVDVDFILYPIRCTIMWLLIYLSYVVRK